MISYTTFKNIKVRYSDKGQGRAIVMLHGFLENSEIWNSFSEKLSKQYRVIAIDLLGFGETPSIGYVHSMELMAECVKKVMDDLNLRRYVLVGHSMGGYAALAFADLFNDHVSGLCLFHSTSLPDSSEKKQDRQRAIDAVKKDHLVFVSNFFDRLFAKENIANLQDEIAKLKNNAIKLSKQSIVNSLEGMKDRKKRDWILEFAKYPILFIVGKQDAVIPSKSILHQAESVKRKEILFLENAGHMGFLESPDECLKAIRRLAHNSFREVMK